MAGPITLAGAKVAVDADPMSFDARMELAAAHSRAGDFVNALRSYKRASKLNAASMAPNFKIGEIVYRDPWRWTGKQSLPAPADDSFAYFCGSSLVRAFAKDARITPLFIGQMFFLSDAEANASFHLIMSAISRLDKSKPIILSIGDGDINYHDQDINGTKSMVEKGRILSDEEVMARSVNRMGNVLKVVAAEVGSNLMLFELFPCCSPSAQRLTTILNPMLAKVCEILGIPRLSGFQEALLASDGSAVAPEYQAEDNYHLNREAAALIAQRLESQGIIGAASDAEREAKWTYLHTLWGEFNGQPCQARIWCETLIGAKAVRHINAVAATHGVLGASHVITGIGECSSVKRVAVVNAGDGLPAFSIARASGREIYAFSAYAMETRLGERVRALMGREDVHLRCGIEAADLDQVEGEFDVITLIIDEALAATSQLERLKDLARRAKRYLLVVCGGAIDEQVLGLCDFPHTSRWDLNLKFQKGYWHSGGLYAIDTSKQEDHADA